jgi:hypothetical protein
MNKRKIVTFDLDENDGFKGVFAVSLVDIPAIESNWVSLRADATLKLSEVDQERRMLYGAALIPDKLILRIDPETKEEYYIKFPRKAIQKIAYNFMKKANQSEATFMHEFRIDGCTVVETWLKESEVDKSAALGLNEPDGTWFIGMKVDSDEVWDKVKSGEVLGFSIEGLFDTASEALRASLNDEEKLLAEIESLLNEL